MTDLMLAFGQYWRMVWEESDDGERVHAAYFRLFCEPMPSIKDAEMEEWDDAQAYQLGRRMRVLEMDKYSLWVLV